MPSHVCRTRGASGYNQRSGSGLPDWVRHIGRRVRATFAPHGLGLVFPASVDCTLRRVLSWVAGWPFGLLVLRPLCGSAPAVRCRRSAGGVARRELAFVFRRTAGAIRDVSRRICRNEFAPVLRLGRSGIDLVPCVPAVKGLGSVRALIAVISVRWRISSCLSELIYGVG